MENGGPVIRSSNLEDHHIFPKDYLHKSRGLFEEGVDIQILMDCVVNRILIPKLTNVRVSNKNPSVYLAELSKKNSAIREALTSHLIPEDILSGIYDTSYLKFLEYRGGKIAEEIEQKVVRRRDELVQRLRP